MITLMQYVFGCILIILNLLLLPVIIASWVVLMRNRNSLHFQKRGIAFLFVHLTVSFFNHGILYPLTIWIRFLDGVGIEFLSSPTLAHQIRRFLLLSFIMAMLVNIIFRLFYQFIQIHRSKHTAILITIPEVNGTGIHCIQTSNKEERSNISTSANNKTSFILDNYDIFGNPTKLCLIGIAVWMFFSLAIGLAAFEIIVNDVIGRIIVYLAIVLILTIFMIGSVIYLVKKQHIFEFEDHWNIKHEFCHYGKIFSFTGTCPFIDDYIIHYNLSCKQTT